MNTVTTQERKIGALLGLAWGDVFGCPVEGWTTREIESIYGSVYALPEEYPLSQIQQMGMEKLKRLRPLGLHSDDTQQSLALINLCLSESGYSTSAWAQILVAGMKSAAWRGFGRNFSQAVHKLQKGISPQKAGSSSAGIGSAMRIAPLGAIYSDNRIALSQVTMESSLVTHGDIRAASLSYAVAWIVAEFCSGSNATTIRRDLPDAVKIVEQDWLTGHPDWRLDRSAGHLISEGLRHLLASPFDDHAGRCNAISAFARPFLTDGFTRAHPNQGFALLGGAHAILEALHDDAIPQDVLSRIVQLGYDTDTVAAICGGILGARFGTHWIPLHRFKDDSIKQYGLDLAETASVESFTELLNRESRWTADEKQFQKDLLKNSNESQTENTRQ